MLTAAAALSSFVQRRITVPALTVTMSLTNMLNLALILALTLAQGSYVPALNSKVMSRARRIGDNFRRLSPDTVLFVDGDNVRGKTGFAVSKEKLIDDLLLFSKEHSFENRLVLLFDHGRENEAYTLDEKLCLVFSGDKTADDIIVRDVAYFQRQHSVPVAIITSDSGLKGRCQRVGRELGLTIVDSTTFIELLEAVSSLPALPDSDGKVEEEETGALSSTELTELAQLATDEVLRQEEEAARERRALQAEQRAELKSALSALPKPDVTGGEEEEGGGEGKGDGAWEDPWHEPPRETAADPSVSLLAEAARKQLRIQNQQRTLTALISRKSSGRKKIAKMQSRYAELQRRLDGLRDDFSGAFDGNDLDLLNAGGGGYAALDYSSLLSSSSSSSSSPSPSTSGSAGKTAWSAAGDKADKLGLQLLQLKPGRDGKGREETWQRCITAERLRCRLLESVLLALRESAEQQSSTPTPLGAAFGASPSLLCNATGQYANLVNAKYSRTNVTNLLSANFDAAASLAAVAAASVPTSLPSFKPIMLDEEYMSSPTLPSASASVSPAVAGPARREKDKLPGQHRLFIPRPDEAGGTTVHGVPYSYDRGCRVYSTRLQPHPLLLNPTSSSSSSSGEGQAQSSQRSRRRVRVVCLSDTHGMEAVLLDHVPDGDVLVHAGDWAPDHGRPTKQTRSFDSFLSLLPHPHKIVVRGNHDPFTSDLRQSKAFYANRPTTVTVDVEGVAIVFSLWPYGSLKPPEPGHVIVSHEPPYNILDETLRKNKSGIRKRAGSAGLLGGLDKGCASSVVVCGHIHESYGSLLHSLPDGDGAMGPVKRPPVLCVNACNANPGAAHSLVNLPTVIDLYI